MRGGPSGLALRWISKRAGFLLSIALTIVCLIGTILFALYGLPSMVLGFAALTVILAGTSVYAGWDWKKSREGTTGSLK